MSDASFYQCRVCKKTFRIASTLCPFCESGRVRAITEEVFNKINAYRAPKEEPAT